MIPLLRPLDSGENENISALAVNQGPLAANQVGISMAFQIPGSDSHTSQYFLTNAFGTLFRIGTKVLNGKAIIGSSFPVQLSRPERPRPHLTRYRLQQITFVKTPPET